LGDPFFFYFFEFVSYFHELYMTAEIKKNILTLYGSRPETHNFLNYGSMDFQTTLDLMIKIIKSGQGRKLTVQIGVITADKVDTSNYYRLHDITRLVLNYKINKIEFNLVNPECNNLAASLDQVAAFISKARYVFLFNTLIKVRGLPYCLLPEPEGVIIKSENSKNFRKLPQCKVCRYDKMCNGILKGYLVNLDKNKIQPLKVPKEVMIEVTPHCNFRCKFCFNRASFSNKTGEIKEFNTTYVKKIIDNIKKSGVPIVRFTGGEPLLRKDIFELVQYAKAQKLQVRLNTNGSLIKDYRTAKSLVECLDYALFSMHTFDPRKDEKITGFKDSFKKKIQVIKWFKKAGIKTIRISTIATLDNIRNLEKFYRLFKELKIDKWATNRIIPLPGENYVWGKRELPVLVEKLIKIKKDIVRNNIALKVHIVNAVPLCAYDPVKMNAVCSGAHSVDGHERFVIDPRGFSKPIYYIEKNIGDPLDILACWNHTFMKSLRNYNNLPIQCRRCPLLEKCKGGNRYCAFTANGSYSSSDPLMNYANIESLYEEKESSIDI